MDSRRIGLLLGVLVFPGWSGAEPLVQRNMTGVAQDQPYYTQDVGNTRLIYTEANKAFAEQAAAIEGPLNALYEASFGYKMDTQLAVGIMSSYNQIANGFSTQFPWNRQINYIGGAQLPDYFSSSSWLDTLLMHETAHNYQVNAKDNKVSQTLFSVFRNGAFYTPFFPAISPNLFESGFMLEGNAVLNESRHGLGGRLYSGRLKALTLVQAKAGYLTPERMYNRTLYFPYGESFYVMGGQYQYYLAQNYGVDTVNKYFKNRSHYWYLPFVVNAPLRSTLGKDFDQTLSEWAAQMEKLAQPMQLAQGTVVARSKFSAPLNEQDGKILFLTNTDGTQRPTLISFDRASSKIDKTRTGHDMGKVFVVDGKPYSVSGRFTSVWRVYQGLFDKGGVVLEGTQGKIIQGYKSDGTAVYFDVEKSFNNPQLLVGDEFYASVNSSVLVNGDDLYYCVQTGRQRTLYRNKEALYSFESYYGFPVDVDAEGRVYFIGNSESGSSLYRVKAAKVERVLAADNVIDARLTNRNEVLVTAISADDYYYALQSLAPRTESPARVNLLWDTASKPATGSEQPQVGAVADAAIDATAATAASEPVAAADPSPQQPAVSQVAAAEPIALGLENKYGFFNNIRYSSGYMSLYTVQEDSDSSTGDEDRNVEIAYNLSLFFEDPFTRSRYSVWALKDDHLSDLVGVGFTNNQYFLLGGINAYYVAHDGLADNVPPVNTRDSGVSAELRLPFLDWGYWDAELVATYYQDYKLVEREPTSFQLRASRTEQFGISMLPNSEYSFAGYQVEDRGDHTQGAEFHFTAGLPRQFYFELGAKYSDSDAQQITNFNRRGVELSNDVDFFDNDPARFHIPSLRDDTYASKVSLGSAALTKVFDGSIYFFKFPLSLRREALLLGYRQFAIEDAANVGDVDLGQFVLGVNLDILLVNILPLTIALEAVYNDNDQLTDETAIQGRFNLAF